MVLHTCNPRLHVQQLIYIINHAEDRALLFDATYAPLMESIAAHCPQVEAWICLSDAMNMPSIAGIANVLCYEELIAAHSDEFDWPQFDERSAAALCYTSGTTGNPKGALYSHRSIVLNALSACLPGLVSLSPRDTVLPAVPMFHVNGWCIPYAAPIGGATLVLPGQRLGRPESLRIAGKREGHCHRGSADDLDRADAAHGATRSALIDSEADSGGRFGHAAIADRQIRQRIRHRSAACLGHDRDCRHRHHERGGFPAGRLARRCAPCSAGQTRQIGFWR